MPFSTHPVALAGVALLPRRVPPRQHLRLTAIVRRRCRCLTSTSIAAAPAAGSGARPAAAPTAASGTPPPPRPFADVIKDAKEQPGLFPLWSKDDKVWIELKPEQFDQLYFCRPILSRGVMSDSPVSMARAMLRGNIVAFRKMGNNVQLIAAQLQQLRKAGDADRGGDGGRHQRQPARRCAVASVPHPERKSVLVEANALLLGDIPMITTALDTTYRAGYALDRPNSYFRETQSRADATTFDVTAHFAIPKAAGADADADPSPVPQPRPVSGVPDARSFFGLFYTLSKLPDEPMRARQPTAVGHSTSASGTSATTRPRLRAST